MPETATHDGGGLAEWLRRLFERGDDDAPPVLGVFGSSRADGNTGALARAVFGELDGARLVDLGALKIAPYDYDHGREGDDFLPLAHAMTKTRALVFASPVYWYSMSAQMKTFFDRLTDLTKTHKTFGRALAGKSAFLLSTGGAPTAPASFEAPFAETARYFDMAWGGALHESFRDDRQLTAYMKRRAAAFAERIAMAASSPRALAP